MPSGNGRTRRQRLRGDAIPRSAPDMRAGVWPGFGGKPGGLPGFPDGATPRAAAYALQAPNYFQPPGAITLRIQGRQTAQVLADGEVTLATVQLNNGQLGVLRIVNVGVTNLLATSAITFRIKVGSANVPGWTLSPFAQSIAVFQQEFPPESTLIELPTNSRLAITSQVADGGVYDVDMMVQGWQYGRAQRDDFEQAWRAGAL